MDFKMPVFSDSSSGSSSDDASLLAVPLGEMMQSAPGFRFNPTDEEIVMYFLKRKMCGLPMKLEEIRTIDDIYKWNPEDLPALSLLKTGDRQWFFLTRVDRKYHHGLRSNRNTGYGLWKLTRNDHNITSDSRKVGVKKTLVFYKGKATKDDRTDWVMHEYTLTEEELRRCQYDVQEFYALCKVFKKSGYDPKNGEQYGAPYREEDWADNGFLGFNFNSSDYQLQLDEDDSVGMVLANGPLLPSSVDGYFDEVHDKLHGPVHNLQVEAYFMRPEIVAEDPQDVVVEQFAEGVNDPEPFGIFLPDGGQIVAEDPQGAVVEQFVEGVNNPEPFGIFLPPGFVYAPDIDMEELYDEDEDEFLEHNGVIDLDIAFANIANPMENMGFEDGLALDDLFNPLPDAEMFLHDMWPEQETFDHSYMNTPESDVGNENFQLLPNEEGANQTGGEFWMHDERNILNPAQENGSFPPPAPGMVYESATEGKENQSSTMGDVATSSLSSALWAYADSIPTTPTSACENALVNQTLGQMSSLTRVRANIKQTNVAVGNGTASIREQGEREFHSILFFPDYCWFISLFLGFCWNFKVIGQHLLRM